MGTLGLTLRSRSPYSSEEFIGRRYGTRVVVGHAERVGSFHLWRVRCDCGQQRVVEASRIAKGRGMSCVGCSVTASKGNLSPSWKGTKNVSSTAYNFFKASADRRKIPWSITINDIEALWIVQGGRCALSGVALRFRAGWQYKRFANASLDRINSKLGYERNNIQLVTSDINFGKQQLSNEAFVAMCKSVVQHAEHGVLAAAE